MLSWGHDEYLYEIVKDQSTLPDEALAMIRYHSFYPWHSGGAYKQFMAEKDHKMLEAVKAFNPYDLYSKSDDVPTVESLKASSHVYLHTSIYQLIPFPAILHGSHRRVLSKESHSMVECNQTGLRVLVVSKLYFLEYRSGHSKDIKVEYCDSDLYNRNMIQSIEKLNCDMQPSIHISCLSHQFFERRSEWHCCTVQDWLCQNSISSAWKECWEYLIQG